MLKRIKVGELIKKGKAHSQTGPFGTQLKASDYVKEGIPVINVRNIGFGEIRSETLEFVDNDMAQELKSHRLEKYDIVFGRKGAVERHSLITSNQVGWIQGSDCIRLRFLTSEFDPVFISFFFRTEQHKQWMINLGSFGATMGSLNQDIISRMEIPDIPLPTQRKIANILSAYDDLIENNKQRIKLLEEMAESIYKEWFVRFRFPGYDGRDRSRPVLTDDGLPVGWEMGTIGDLYNVKSGFAFKSEELGDVGSPIIKIRNIDNLEVDTLNCDRYSGEINERVKKFELYNGDLIVAMTGATIGKVALFNNQKEPYYLNQRVGKFFHKTNYLKNQAFVYQFAKTNEFKDNINNYALGAAQPNISGEQIENIKLIIPAKELLVKFSDLAGDIIEEIFFLKQKNLLLQQTRDLLLPRLISGKLDISGMDINLNDSVLTGRDLPLHDGRIV